MRIPSLVGASSALLLCSCGGVDIHDYAEKQPVMTVQGFYSAPVEGYGFFQDRSGKVTDRYFATLVPTWNGNVGTLVEKQWDDKGRLFLQQTWKIRVADNGNDFNATGTKIDGGVKGETSGFAMHMTYTLIAATDNGDDIKLDADDWTYLQPDGSVINKVALSKYGFHVGDTIYELHKVPKGEPLKQNYFSK